MLGYSWAWSTAIRLRRHLALLFAILAFGISGYTTMGAAITSMMGHNVVFQVIVGFITAGSLSHYGFGSGCPLVLTRKISRKAPALRVGLYYHFGVSAVVINQIALSIILYSIWQDIADNCGYPKHSSFRYVGMGGILMGTILGGA